MRMELLLLWHTWLPQALVVWSLQQQVQGFVGTVVSRSPRLAASVSLAMKTKQRQTVHANEEDSAAISRRMAFASALMSMGGIIAGGTTMSPEDAVAAATAAVDKSRLEWEATPINKRTGVTVFDAETAGYNVRFVTYLSRFLLNFDDDCQRWWFARAADIPRTATLDQVEATRLSQFGAFAASVEVGLQEYKDPKEGPKLLMESLLERYCPDNMELVEQRRTQQGLPPLTPAQEESEKREIAEARRQIALLFGLMETNQPTEAITGQLAAIANGTITSVTVQNPGGGYAPGYGPPLVTFPPPKAQGSSFVQATGRAKLIPTGQLLRIDVMDRGNGYTPNAPPTVTIAPPLSGTGRPATAKATVFARGPNQGKVASIILEDAGEGYTEKEKISVTLSPPVLDMSKASSSSNPQWGGVTATAHAVLEYQVGSIDIVNGGSGYAVEKPIRVEVEPPPVTARVNMNDPFYARLLQQDKPSLPATRKPPISTKALEDIWKDPNSIASLADRLATNDGKGGGGGCIGRACYDQQVVAIAIAESSTSSFSNFRFQKEVLAPLEREASIEQARFGRSLPEARRVISATSSGEGPSAVAPPGIWSRATPSTSSQLLTLIPAGIGLEYDVNAKRYVLTAAPDFSERSETWLQGISTRPLDPEFGPRGRSPIERDLQLNLDSYLRFCLSGAICCAGVHLAVTPLDVVKTKVQTDPENYPGPIAGFSKLLEERGITGFFAGWLPTFAGWFVWGGFTYSLTEFLRRYLIDLAGSNASTLEVPIVLTASAVAAFFGVFLVCPFESVRIRSVSQPGYGSNPIEITSRMVAEEGIASLFNAVPPLLLKEIPFAMAKFATFGVATRLLFERFPAAQEDIQLSLVVSLVAGAIGGMVAAVVSNPGDATVSEMKKSKSDEGAVATALRLTQQTGGVANLMRGLPLRLVFYPFVVSLQFLVYDTVRLSLGIGSDDLKVYLDVLGGALKDGGNSVGPI